MSTSDLLNSSRFFLTFSADLTELSAELSLTCFFVRMSPRSLYLRGSFEFISLIRSNEFWPTSLSLAATVN